LRIGWRRGKRCEKTVCHSFTERTFFRCAIRDIIGNWEEGNGFVRVCVTYHFLWKTASESAKLLAERSKINVFEKYEIPCEVEIQIL
jgi:hypothetical protein